MMEFAGVLTEGGGSIPMFGDSDDGYVLDLGDARGGIHSLLSVGAVLFGRPELKAWSGGYKEPVRWLLGATSRAEFEGIKLVEADKPLQSNACGDSGHYLIQSGRAGSRERLSVLVDCGELGFGPIAAHGHADALSFTLRAFGEDVFVDPGTFDYFSSRPWREYFRSTKAHNTVVVDDADQSVALGLFLWGRRAQSRCVRWEPWGDGGIVVGEHDGYARLNDPVTHRRSVALRGADRTVTIQDELLARGRHAVALYFHLAVGAALKAVRADRCEISMAGGDLVLEMDPRLRIETLQGAEQPIGGWVSPGYHRKTPALSIIGRGVCEGNSTLTCRITIGDPVSA
jgi:hypothetical protein